MHSGKIDFVTVSYNKEIRLLQLQARSICKFADPNTVGTIYIVSNENRFGDFKRIFMRDVLPEYGKFSEQVVLLDHKDIAKKTRKTIGWESQQVFKLMISKFVTTPVYVVLDSKNHLVAPLGYSSFFASDGRLITMRKQMNEKLGKLFNNACDLFSVAPTDENYERALPMATPFPLVTAEVKSMISFMEKESGTDFFDAFTVGGRYCEFYTYYAWLLRTEGLLNTLYVAGANINLTFWNKEQVAREGMDVLMGKLSEDRYLTMGIHRKIIRDATESQREKIISFWRARGLVNSVNEGNYFLSEHKDERAYIVRLAGKIFKPVRRWQRKRAKKIVG